MAIYLVEPAETSVYSIQEGVVSVPDCAAERKGIQPIVNLLADGVIHRIGKIGETVRFKAEIQLPKGSGELEEVLWDFEETDRFLPRGSFSKTEWREDGTGIAWAEAEYAFPAVGIKFPVVKVASNHTPGDAFTRIRNQARVRVTVTE